MFLITSGTLGWHFNRKDYRGHRPLGWWCNDDFYQKRGIRRTVTRKPRVEEIVAQVLLRGLDGPLARSERIEMFRLTTTKK